MLVCIARDSGIRLRDIGERVGITERAAHRIVAKLAAAGYVARAKRPPQPLHDQPPPAAPR